MKMMWCNKRWSQIHEDLWKTWVHGKSKRGGPTRIHVPDSPTLVPISVCDRVGESSPWKIWSRSSLVLKYISDGNETVFFHGTTFLLGWLLCSCCVLFGDRTRNDSRVGRDLYRTRVLAPDDVTLVFSVRLVPFLTITEFFSAQWRGVNISTIASSIPIRVEFTTLSTVLSVRSFIVLRRGCSVFRPGRAVFGSFKFGDYFCTVNLSCRTLLLSFCRVIFVSLGRSCSELTLWICFWRWYIVYHTVLYFLVFIIIFLNHRLYSRSRDVSLDWFLTCPLEDWMCTAF